MLLEDRVQVDGSDVPDFALFVTPSEFHHVHPGERESPHRLLVPGCFEQEIRFGIGPFNEHEDCPVNDVGRRRGRETRCPFDFRFGNRRSHRAPEDDRIGSRRRRCRTLHPGPGWNTSGPISVAVRVSASVRRRSKTRSGAHFRGRVRLIRGRGALFRLALLKEAGEPRSRGAIYVAYYNFCWMHGSLNGTPAMAAKVASHPWSIDELYERVMGIAE